MGIFYILHIVLPIDNGCHTLNGFFSLLQTSQNKLYASWLNGGLLKLTADV